MSVVITSDDSKVRRRSERLYFPSLSIYKETARRISDNCTTTRWKRARSGPRGANVAAAASPNRNHPVVASIHLFAQLHVSLWLVKGARHLHGLQQLPPGRARLPLRSLGFSCKPAATRRVKKKRPFLYVVISLFVTILHILSAGASAPMGFTRL